jgi:ferrous iron transport protein B
VFALPAGVIIWLSANIHIGTLTIAEHLINVLDPIAIIFGLNGIIFLAYIIAIPANEIVVPTILMLTVMSVKMVGIGSGAGVMFEIDNAQTAAILQNGGWTLLTAVNLMLFSLLHNPCSTTIYTIYKETGSVKWTLVSTFLPIAMGLAITFIITLIWRF